MKAPLLAAYAHECWLTDKVTRAVASQEEAVASYREAADPAEEGRAISDLAEYLWWNSESDGGYSPETARSSRYWSRPGPCQRGPR